GRSRAVIARTAWFAARAASTSSTRAIRASRRARADRAKRCFCRVQHRFHVDPAMGAVRFASMGMFVAVVLIALLTAPAAAAEATPVATGWEEAHRQKLDELFSQLKRERSEKGAERI